MPDASPAIRVRNLTVRRGAHIALHGIDAAVPRGSSTVLVGPNGAGKTTFLLCLAGELSWSGDIEILPVDGRAPRISFVPQYVTPAAHMPLTVMEFLSLECGCITYHTLRRVETTTHIIDSIIILNDDVKTSIESSGTNLRIYFRTDD